MVQDFKKFTPGLASNTGVEGLAKEIYELRQAVRILWDSYNAGITLSSFNYHEIEILVKQFPQGLWPALIVQG